jgi:hypothetical protein
MKLNRCYSSPVVNPSLINSMFRASIPAIVVLSFIALSKFVPFKLKNSPAHKYKLSDLDDRFMPLKARILGSTFLVGLALLLGLWVLLTGLSKLLARLEGPADFRFYYQPAIWWFFPAMAALSLCWEVTLQI